MRCLYVLYDAKCGLCCRVKEWLGSQPAALELVFVAAGSEEARRLFPQLPTTREELVVVSDEGEVYSGNAAWIMCLYALTDYRDLSYRLSSPLLLPLAKSAFSMLSEHRQQISRWMRATTSDREIAARLRLAADECVQRGEACGIEARP